MINNFCDYFDEDYISKKIENEIENINQNNNSQVKKIPEFVIVDSYFLSIITDKPIGFTLPYKDIIELIVKYVTINNLSLEDIHESTDEPIISIPPPIKKMLNINIDHNVSMKFLDFVYFVIFHPL